MDHMDYKSKRNKILEDLKVDLLKGRRERDVLALGRKFKLHTLNEDEESWADSYIRATSTMAIISTKKAPALAAAISEVEGTPVGALFDYPEDMPKEVKEALDKNQIQRAYWVREQMLMFLVEESNRKFINVLYSSFEEMLAERDEAMGQIPN
jgi:small-conductance mechanosensitive channel